MKTQQKVIIEKGKDIYYKIKPQLERKYKPGFYVTIEVNTGKYFIGRTPIDALESARKEFPTKQFFLAQVGKLAGISWD